MDADIERRRSRLRGRFKVPEHVLVLHADELPTTATGKVQKYRLAEWARKALATLPESPTDNVEANP